MVHSSANCPRCSAALEISSDMWGRFYACQGCGFTAEDDETLRVEWFGSSAVTDDDLPWELRRRVRSLLNDLTCRDLSMAFLDLAQLCRSLAAISGERKRPERPAGVPTLIYSEDESAIEDACEGPLPGGICPRAATGDPVVCAGRWITAKGWMFKVAPEAEMCPLTGLGLAPAAETRN